MALLTTGAAFTATLQLSWDGEANWGGLVNWN